MNLKPTIIILMGTIGLLMSCNNEELFETELITEIIEEPSETNEVDNINEDEDVDASLPCDFDLSFLKSGDTVSINCILDLGGSTVNLPSDVTILYEGGDIINGTLNFSENTTIDGQLLNLTLTTTGTSPILRDPVFHFDPNRWGIIEGNVSDEVARRNKEIIQDIIDFASSIGVNTITIDKMDCYVGVGGNFSLDDQTFKDGISLPSNFNLRMSSSTYLRVQPNSWPKYNVLNAFKQKNVTITGGNIIGDRYEHNYVPINDEFGINRDSHEYGSLISIAGSHDVVVDGVTMRNSIADAFVFASGTHRQYTPAIYCKNVTLRNCTLDGSRRNNITVGDGEYLYIENNTILNAGGGENILDENGKIKTYTSAGVAPQFGIDMEAHREMENGVYVDYQIVENVFVRGNTFRGNYAGDIVLFTANDILIENNDCDNLIGGLLFWNTTIRNNTITQRSTGVKTPIGILYNGIEDVKRVHNNKIIGNEITGFDTGISILGQNIEVKDNIVRDFKEGFYLRELYDSEISNNDLQSDRTISHGYLSFGGLTSNVIIRNDNINVKHRPVYFYGFNEKTTNDNLTIESSIFISPKELYLENAKNVTIRNNQLAVNKEIRQVNCENIVTENNN
ncbi:NosD domain-containing protein [Flavobacteriaceae bacterium SZ-1-7]|uniref:hypothetical protein n=1 Tax=Tamlana sedimenti TaxID=3134126 RepID=UPI003126C27A